MFTRKNFSIKDFDSDNETKTIEGYGSVFGNYDSDDDRFMKGCYHRSITDWGPTGKDRIKLCKQHCLWEPVASITELKEDDYGLKFKAQFGRSQASTDAYYDVADKIISELSVGFKWLKYDVNEREGKDFTDVKLYEISLVTIGANDRAHVTNVKSEYKRERFEHILRYVKNLNNKEQAFELERRLLNFYYDLADSSLIDEQIPAQEKENETALWLKSIAHQLNLNGTKS